MFVGCSDRKHFMFKNYPKLCCVSDRSKLNAQMASVLLLCVSDPNQECCAMLDPSTLHMHMISVFCVSGQEIMFEWFSFLLSS